MVWAVSLSTMKLIPHCLTPKVRYIGIGGLVGFGKLTPPSPSRALPPPFIPKAAPQCISGRTSYLQVRLAFHLYPQLIPGLCNDHEFGPSLRDYRSFTLAIGSSPGFGSNPRDSFALLRLAFASAPFVHEVNLAAEINSSAHSSISTPSSLLTERLRPYVGPRFQIYFTPLPGFFSPFPHGTGTLSVAKGI